ncbi:MAG: putative lipid II flippase FtsW [Mariprofundales bacterium]
MPSFLSSLFIHPKRSPDILMLIAMLTLLLLGLVMVTSASMNYAAMRYGDAWHFVVRWSIYIVLGLCVVFAVSRIAIERWRSIALPLFLVCILLLLGTHIPGIQLTLNGASRWIGFAGITFQPSEMVYPLAIVYLAHYMGAHQDRLSNFARGLAPMLFVSVLPAMLMLLQPDFGGAVVLLLLCACLWFVGGVPLRHLFGLVIVLLPLIYIALSIKEYRLRRLLAFVDPFESRYGDGYQLVQSLLAFGSGGLWGVGLGQGIQKLYYLPEPFTDFIVSVLAEELGMLGVLTLMLLFLLLLGRAMYLFIYRLQLSVYAMLLASGCVIAIGLSVLINLGVVMGVLPTKGLPMPLISYGGSALMADCFLLGILFSIQQHSPLRQNE